MGRWSAALAWTLLATMPFSGCIGDQSDAGAAATSQPYEPPADPQVAELAQSDLVKVVEDPAGDATDMNPGAAKSVLSSSCGTVGVPEVSEPCREAVAGLPEDGGVPAPPERDALGVYFADTPDSLVVEAEIGTVSDALEDSIGEEGYIEFTVCWTTSEHDCNERVRAWLIRVRGETEWHSQFIHYGSPDCPYAECSVAIPYTLEPGSPGRIRWVVPRAVLPNATIEDALERPQLYLYSVFYGGYGQVEASATGPQGAHTVSRAIHGTYGHLVDTSDPGQNYRFSTPQRPLDPARLAWTVYADEDGDARLSDGGGADLQEQRRDVDLQEVRVVETRDDLKVAIKMAAVDEVPLDYNSRFTLGTSSGGFVEFAHQGRGGVRTNTTRSCDNVACTKATELNATVEIVVGMPGWINVTLARSDLGDPHRGDLITRLNLYALPWTGQATPEDSAVPAYVRYRTDWDGIVMVPPFAFQIDPAATLSESASLVTEDPTGDVNVEVTDDPALNVLTRDNHDQFDITFVGARGLTETEFELTLGVQDLRQITVPNGYAAALYAVALETDQGPVLAALYKRSDGTQEFLCAPDTVVFVDTKSDPIEGVWQAIAGTISVGTGTGGGESGSSGGTGGSVITFVMPHSCLGMEQARSVHVERLAAGSFLIRTSVGQGVGGDVSPVSAPLDSVERFDSFTIMAAGVAAPPWYAAPFGIENFWDIMGIVGAAVISLFGLFAVRRRQHRLKRYLAAVDAAAAQKDPRTRESSLRALREQLKNDLTRRRISESHYVIVESRLDEHLSKARLETLSDAFGQLLPYQLMLKLQALIGDGNMSRDDLKRFTRLLEDSIVPPKVQTKVLGRLGEWVAQDTPAVKRRRRSA